MKGTKQVYEVNLKANLKMFGFSAFTLFAMFALWSVVALIKGGEVTYDIEIIKILFIVFLIFLLPAIYLHIEYLLENYNTRLTIDYRNKQLNIKRGKTNYDYSFEDILESILYRSIYYKNEVDNAHRWKTVFSDYGYWFMRFNDGERFFFTSLMINISEKPLIESTETRYLFFTNIKESELAKEELEQDLE